MQLIVILEPIHEEADTCKYLQASVNPTIMDALFELTKQRPQDPVLWLANYLMKHNPFKPQVGSASPESLAKIAEIERKMKEFELERDIEETNEETQDEEVTCDDNESVQISEK